jgi:hypothetical protein
MQHSNPSYANNTHFSAFPIPSQAMPGLLWNPPISIPPVPQGYYRTPICDWPSSSLPPVNSPPFPIDSFAMPDLPRLGDQPLVTRTHQSPDLFNAPTLVRRTPKRRTHLSEQERFRNLENDSFIMAFTPTEVYCAGCEATLRLGW